LLGTEHGGGGEVFVYRRQEFDAVLVDEVFGAPEFEIDAAERRAAIAGNKAAGAEAPALSRLAWSSATRTSACVPVMKTRPESWHAVTEFVVGQCVER
jgi:hypothetical protein